MRPLWGSSEETPSRSFGRLGFSSKEDNSQVKMTWWKRGCLSEVLLSNGRDVFLREILRPFRFSNAIFHLPIQEADSVDIFGFMIWLLAEALTFWGFDKPFAQSGFEEEKLSL
jgi:hypothetical protein